MADTEKVVEEEQDREEEKKYSPSAPMRRISFDEFMQYKDMILSDCYHHYYVTDDWNPEFYTCLAYEGFISVSHDKYLIPEIQVYYGVLTFDNLHIGRKVKKVIRKYTTPPPTIAHVQVPPMKNTPRYTLRLYESKYSALCISRIQAYWGSKNWLTDQYVACMRASGVRVHTFELFLECIEDPDVVKGTVNGSNREVSIGCSRTLVAGEIGYTIGSVYTSLTGTASMCICTMLTICLSG